jgi:hypothetical protein
MAHRLSARYTTLTTLLYVLGACSHLQPSDAPSSVWGRLGHSVTSAATQTEVWVPAAAAALFRVGDWDEHMSDWAVDHTPIFGSPENADRWSDNLETASTWAMYGSILAVPSDREAPGKLMTLAVDVVASWTTDEVTDAVKRATDRDRPNGRNRLSFPSGHTSGSFVHTTLAKENLDALPAGWSTTADYALTTMAIATGWARIEAEQHYPSDVLFGAALGNFLAHVFINGFLAMDDETNLLLRTDVGRGNGYLSISLRY